MKVIKKTKEQTVVKLMERTMKISVFEYCMLYMRKCYIYMILLYYFKYFQRMLFQYQ